MTLTILFCTMSMHTMCILFASYARLESLQAKNWALSRCCPRGPVGENIYPLHRGTFVERLEHHCHGGSLPVLAGRDGGSRSRICCYVSFPQFFGWIFVAHHLTTAWDRVQGLFHVSVVGPIFSRMVVILAVNTSNFHEFSLLVWVSSLLFTSGQIEWIIRPDQHLVEESQLAMGFAEAPVILRAPSPRGTLREWRLWRCLHHMHPLTDPPRSTKFGLPGSEPPKMPLLPLLPLHLHNAGGSESLQAFDVPWTMTTE